MRNARAENGAGIGTKICGVVAKSFELMDGRLEFGLGGASGVSIGGRSIRNAK